MKTHRILLLTALMALPGLLPAQTSGVPEFISYQGLVLDSAGAPVGTGTPVNRKVIFRVWDHPSNVLEANLIYSEEQTVTIADGKFSVLVGQGVGSTGGQFTFSETAYGPDANPSVSIANAFNGSGRYLGVTVDDGTTAVDNEIAPRQQVVSSAFAFRSKFAETLGSGATGGNSLTQITGGSFAVSGANTTTTTVNPQFLITADDITERLRIGVDSTGNGTSFLQSWKEGTGATNLLLNPNGGNVGIGTTTPNAALDVNGAIMIRNALTSASPRPAVGSSRVPGELSGYGGVPAADDGFLRLSAGGGTAASQKSFIDLTGYSGLTDMNRTMVFGTSGTEQMRINSSGNVGIRTTLAVAGNVFVGAKLDVHGATNIYAKLDLHGATNISNYLKQTLDGIGASAYRLDYTATHAYGLYVSARTLAPAYDVLSDERIKVIKGVSDGAKDLEILSKIDITDYTHKDTELYSTRPEKKVIAQQVEKVFPQAVNRGVNAVPDIYAAALVKDAWLELKTDLKPGERVRLIDEKGAAVYEVLEVKEGKFRADYVPVGDKVFVYGREVKDFRSVDYDAIAMLNVSATQEMAKRVEAVTKENADLKARLAASELRLAEEEAAGNVRDSKLAAIEKQLSALSVSLKPATD
jgi:hypothetical protein